jgi:hypothetical protein
MAKKTNHEAATLRKGKTPAASKVTEAKPASKGTASAIASNNPDGDPGRRTGNCSGGPTTKGKEN